MKYNYVWHLRLVILFLIIGLVFGIWLGFSIPSIETMQEVLTEEGVSYTLEEIKSFITTYRILFWVVVPLAFGGFVNAFYLYGSYIKYNKIAIIISCILSPIVFVLCVLIGTIFIIPMVGYDALAIIQGRYEKE